MDLTKFKYFWIQFGVTNSEEEIKKHLAQKQIKPYWGVFFVQKEEGISSYKELGYAAIGIITSIINKITRYVEDSYEGEITKL